jgi:hypothetical protein
VAATVACSACGPQVPSSGAVSAANCQPLPGTSASSALPVVPNGTPLLAEPLPSPTSAVRLSFATPELAEEIPVEALSSYPVRLVCDAAGKEGTWIEVALDGGRPRRLAAPLATIALGQLVAVDAQLTPGLHWLFAAAVLDSGLVPRTAAGLPRAAVARRFFVGKRLSRESGPTGALWLRRPEGTYNGPATAHQVLFDVFLFSAPGAAQDLPYTVSLRGPTVSGELRFASPFAVYDVPSGDYEIAVSAATAMPLSTHFVVNRELGGAP